MKQPDHLKRGGFFTPSRIIFYFLAIVIFGLAIHYIGKLRDIRALLLQMSPAWLFLACAVQVATYLINAVIMQVLLKGKSGSTNYFSLFKMSIVIMFVNQALPTGGLSGNGYLFKELVKRQVHRSPALNALVLETVSYYAAMLLLLTLFYGYYSQFGTLTNPLIFYTVLTGFAFYIVLGIVVLLLSNRHTIAFVLKKLGRFGWISRYLKKLHLPAAGNKNEGTRSLFKRLKKPILIVIALQVGIILSDALTAFALVKGFHVELSFGLVTLALLLSLVIGALPLSPGSLIVYESAMTFFFTTLGTPVHAALIITLLYRFLTFWLPIPIGLLLYRNLQRDDNAAKTPNKQCMMMMSVIYLSVPCHG